MEPQLPRGFVPISQQELKEFQEKAEKLESVRDHMKSYPDEKNDKYSIEKHHPSPAGSHFFNSVLFLTHLDTWHKQLKEILEGVDKKMEEKSP